MYTWGAFYGDAMFVPFGGTQTWRPLSNKNICHCFLLLKRKIIALEIRRIEINASSYASAAYLVKTKAITHLKR